MEPPEDPIIEYRRARELLDVTQPESPDYLATLHRYAQAHQRAVRRQEAERRLFGRYAVDARP